MVFHDFQARLDSDFASTWTEPDRIGKEIKQDLLESLTVEIVDLVRQILHIDLEFNLLVLRLNLHKFHALLDAVTDVTGLVVGRENAVSEEIEVTQVTHLVLEMLCRAVDQTQNLDVLSDELPVVEFRLNL